MAQSTFPIPSTGSSYSSQPPANASSVVLDGSLVNSGYYSTTISGSGLSFLLYANGGTTTFTIGGNGYTVTAGSTVGTAAFSGSQTVNITAPQTPTFADSSAVPNADYFGSIGYGNVNGSNAWFANGSSHGAIFSTNGTTWTALSTTGLGTTTNLIYANSYWAGINGSYVIYSSNGSTWSTASTSYSVGMLANIAYGNGVWVAGGQQASGVNATNYFQYASSLSGTWTTGTFPVSNIWSQSVYGVAGTTGIGTFVIVPTASSSGGGTSTGPIYSTNGTTWTLASTDGSDRWWSIAYGNGYFLAPKANGFTNKISISNNGSSFTTYSTLPSNDYWGSIAYGNGMFVAAVANWSGYSSNKFAYSTNNGFTWTAGTFPSTNYWNQIAFGNGVFQICGGSSSQSQTSNVVENSTITNTPVTFGIYNGPTTTH